MMCLFSIWHWSVIDLNHLEAFLGVMEADAALIHRPENMRWLSGYTGEGCLFVAQGTCALLTDFRYVEQAHRQAPDWALSEVHRDSDYPKLIAELARAHGAKRIRVETDHLTYDAYRELEKALDPRPNGRHPGQAARGQGRG